MCPSPSMRVGWGQLQVWGQEDSVWHPLFAGTSSDGTVWCRGFMSHVGLHQGWAAVDVHESPSLLPWRQLFSVGQQLPGQKVRWQMLPGKHFPAPTRCDEHPSHGCETDLPAFSECPEVVFFAQLGVQHQVSSCSEIFGGFWELKSLSRLDQGKGDEELRKAEKPEKSFNPSSGPGEDGSPTGLPLLACFTMAEHPNALRSSTSLFHSPCRRNKPG